MTANFRGYQLKTVEKDGRRWHDNGVVSEPPSVLVTEIDGDTVGPTPFSIPAGGTLRCLIGSLAGKFKALTIRIHEAGQLHFAIIKDTPVSSSDKTPSGNNRRAVAMPDISCSHDLSLCNADTLMRSVATEDDDIEGSGAPKVFTDTGTVQAVVSEVWLKNPTNATATVVGEFAAVM